MTETLFSATLAVAKMLPHVVVQSAATGDGAVGKTTLVDTSAWFVSPTTLPADDYFNGGTIWFIDQVTGTANDGSTAIVTDYATAGTYTFAAISAQTKTGDTYAACPRFYPRFILRQAVNYALSEVGGEDLYSTSLVTVNNQMSYDLPSGVYNVKRVEIASATSSPYGYVAIDPGKWREINDDIVFIDGAQPMSTDYIIRLTYRVPFSELTTDAGALPDLVDMNWIKWAGAAYCMRWKLGLTSYDEPHVREMLTEAITRAEMQAAKFRPKVQQMPKDWPHSPWATGSVDTYIEPGTVRLR